MSKITRYGISIDQKIRIRNLKMPYTCSKNIEIRRNKKINSDIKKKKFLYITHVFKVKITLLSWYRRYSSVT